MLRTEVMSVTPELAEKWLNHLNTNNRPVTQSVVDKYEQDMIAGRFNGLNGATISFTSDNVLSDGQHRLWAVVQSRKTVVMLVVFGVDPDAIETIDHNKPRSVADSIGLT